MNDGQPARYTIYTGDDLVRDEEYLIEADDLDEAERKAQKLLRKFDHVWIYKNDERLIWHNGKPDCESDN